MVVFLGEEGSQDRHHYRPANYHHFLILVEVQLRSHFLSIKRFGIDLRSNVHFH